MKSCIYKGLVSHRRLSPATHQFRHSLFMMYIDLDELPTLFNGFLFWSLNRINLASFNRKDHFGDESQPLQAAVREQICKATGKQHTGPIRLLTHLRYFGYCFNPVSFYYCFDVTGSHIEFIVCEVSNTPWNEKHIYVLDNEAAVETSGMMTFEQPKVFHVSPFMPMTIDYQWHFSEPSEKLNVHMANHQQGEKIFDATLHLKKQPVSSLNLARILIEFPMMTVKVVLLIYYQALILWFKKVPFLPHPGRKKLSGETPT